MIHSGIIATVCSICYCCANNIHIFSEQCHIWRKTLLNIRTFVVGTSTSYWFLQSSTIITNISIIEEIARIISYSLIAEFVFYWVHRYMHINKWIYTNIHRKHHIETIPSPIDAYILSTTEAFFVVLAFISPTIFGLCMTARGLTLIQVAHVTFATLSHGALHTNHHMLHHKYLKGNYGSVHTIWDKVFGTNISML